MHHILSKSKKFLRKQEVHTLKMPYWEELSLEKQWSEALKL